jgi:hypothetical protein
MFKIGNHQVCMYFSGNREEIFNYCNLNRYAKQLFAGLKYLELLVKIIYRPKFNLEGQN